jgi:hypothetical protein
MCVCEQGAMWFSWAEWASDNSPDQCLKPSKEEPIWIALLNSVDKSDCKK